MLAALRVLWRALRHLNHRGYVYVWANLLWFALSLPLITAPAAWAGLVKMSRTAYTTPSGDLNDFLEGFRENLRRGALMAVLNVVIVGLNVANFLAYQNQTDPTAYVLRGAWLLILATWFALQFYMWPLLYEMKEPSLAGALRNAGVMILLNPVFTLVLWLGVVLIIALSTILIAAWPLLTGGALAAIATGAVLDRLESAGIRQTAVECEESFSA
jgi:uncharacterized membrane protein YesL